MILIDAYTKLAGFSCEYFVPTLGRETMTNFVYNPAQHRGYQTVHSRKNSSSTLSADRTWIGERTETKLR